MSEGLSRVKLKEAREHAKDAGLHYTAETHAGLFRKRKGSGFTYVDDRGRSVRDPHTLSRIRHLVLPPAWENVWISKDPLGHLQATGVDQRGRKQYRYHPKWRQVRDGNKFDRMIAFGRALPKIRAATARHLARPGLPREKVLAAIVRLLEKTLIRVGNERYARTNKHYGLTTIRNHHVAVRGGRMRFAFVGKSGIDREIDLQDERLAAVVRACQHLPGQELFEYVDDRGRDVDVTSSDVNAYLHDIIGRDFTAKDFRTWAGTVLAAQALQEVKRFDSNAQAKKNVVAAIESVAKRLGNTAAVCRKCYVHPAVLESYLDGSLLDMLEKRVRRELATAIHRLRPEEAAVLAFLQEKLHRQAKAGGRS